ncbi:MAG: hypothetical protein O3A12_04390 [Actinobacteria bacterium]|nr:hypothetical protein [Actinomycetota bacterium]MDA2984623.1 hypothetical protein [Actinomycetota bacterium]
MKGTTMDEKSLLKQWSQMRSQIITAQIAPALVLVAIFVLASLGLFDSASDGAKYLTIGVAAATGILATISQYAAVREGEALLADLSKIEDSTALAKKIAGSRGLISLSAIAIVALDVAIFALVIWAVLG